MSMLSCGWVVMSMSDIGYRVYGSYVLNTPENGVVDHRLEVDTAREDLIRSMMASPDFHHDALRNGVQQGLLLTRGGEQHTYNVKIGRAHV